MSGVIGPAGILEELRETGALDADGNVDTSKIDENVLNKIKVHTTVKILSEIDKPSNLEAAGALANRFEQTHYDILSERLKLKPLLKYSEKERFLTALDGIHPLFVESLGIAGQLRDTDKPFDALELGDEKHVLEVLYDFSVGQPTKTTVSLFPYTDKKQAGKIIANVPVHMMPRGKWKHPSLVFEQIVRLGDYADPVKIVDAAVLTGEIKYGGRGKLLTKVWDQLAGLASNYEHFMPEQYFLRINESRRTRVANRDIG